MQLHTSANERKNWTMNGAQAIVDSLVEALSATGEINDAQERARAYYDARVDFSSLTLDAIREADRLATDIELGRRVTRS